MCERHYRRMLHKGSTDAPAPPPDVLSLVDKRGPKSLRVRGRCWRWTGHFYSNGYGKLQRVGLSSTLAHRIVYALLEGPIPEGLELDHLCRHRWCVRPSHLEPVTRAVNIQRGYQARMKDRCRNGHDIASPDALKPGTTQCVACWRDRYRRAGKKYRRRIRATHDQ